MNPLKYTSLLAIGTVMVAGGIILSSPGPGTLLVSTYAALTALLLTVVGLWVNTYRNASGDRSMGRLLHDPEPAVAGAHKVSMAASRSGGR